MAAGEFVTVESGRKWRVISTRHEVDRLTTIDVLHFLWRQGRVVLSFGLLLVLIHFVSRTRHD